MQLICENLSFRYPSAEAALFSDLDLRLDGPGFHSLFGPSGVGKTTLARIITGEITQNTGTVSRPGIVRAAYTYSLERLPNWSPIWRHLAEMIPPQRRLEQEGLVEAFGLEPCMDQRFSQLSHGQKNRVNLMRYLLQGFDLLVLDESLANVDELTRQRIILRIKALFPDTMFLYISHNVIEVAKCCQAIVVFRGGVKSPPVLVRSGLDLREDQQAGQQRLQETMLEIMDAG